ncbi:nucleobindin-2 [Tribolium castaneum]|uniref:Nucleobindin-2-like Protein n=1 Tax=Tribolium castaneum TaxID=7070 RepID=D6WHU5_TRICA|nr:PREDICTED: nucleobindin-2 [Tribolium castaneum]EFA00695.1 Nucleobindin-2-like Protein [Tribolium castaneum]|eukprot:XP_968511.2 PREDICTED: nucleobindin-2 [Tribolium castaneum]
MNRYIPFAFFLISVLQVCFAPPVTQNKDKDKEKGEDEIGGLEDYMEYHRYLQEVVNALESDPQFRQKLEKADETDIRSGKIAEELEFVSHHVRSRLDEIKRVELVRLKELTEKKRQLQQNIDLEDPSHHHLDHSNPHTFEIDDLKKLIAKTTADLAEADKKRREEFKQYELQKEFEKQEKLNHTNGEDREKLEREFREREEKHKKHEKLHEPGHKAQLEEVWKEQDQMQQEFDPKTFFMLHDIDGNGLWDQDEVKALFIKELQKMYAAGEPEDDMRERAEEMERMRESVFSEVDVNRDGFIDYEEFLAQTKRNDFQQDHGWQGLDERKPYTDEELEEYIRRHQAANQIPHGYPPQGYAQHPPPGYHPNVAVHPNGVPVQQYHPGQVPQQQFHPGQLSQQHPQQLQGHLPDLNTNEVYPQQRQQQYQQPPQHYQQQQYQQMNYQQHPQQVNYQQQHPQVPVQNQQQQHPQVPVQQNQQQHPQAVNQQQVPVQNQQQAANQQVPVQNQQIPVQNQQQQIPVQNQPQGVPQVQGNVQQGAPQASNPNLNNAQANQV